MSSQKSYLAKFNKLIMPVLFKIQRLSAPNLEKELSKLDITLSEFRIVGLLMGEDKGHSQKELATELGITSASLSVSIQGLENKGVIDRVTDLEDQRVKRIIISPNVDFKEIGGLILKLDEKATKGIKKKDLDTTHGVLLQILQNMS